MGYPPPFTLMKKITNVEFKILDADFRTEFRPVFYRNAMIHGKIEVDMVDQDIFKSLDVDIALVVRIPSDDFISIGHFVNADGYKVQEFLGDLWKRLENVLKNAKMVDPPIDFNPYP